jgi:hypothetical protein
MKVLRLTLKEILKNGKKDSNDNILINNKIVSLFYFRSGYTERDFIDDVIIYL